MGGEHIFFEGSPEKRDRFLFLYVRSQETSVLTSLHRSSMVRGQMTRTGSTCNNVLLKTNLPSIQSKSCRDVSINIDGACKKNSTHLTRRVTSRRPPALLRSEVTEAILELVNAEIFAGREKAVNRRCFGGFKWLRMDLLCHFKGVIEHKCGRGSLYKLPIFVDLSVRQLNLSVYFCFRSDAKTSSHTARPSALTTRHSDAGVSKFRGAVTFITTRTVTEAVRSSRLDQESAVQNSRQIISRLFAEGCATVRKTERKDVWTIIFIIFIEKHNSVQNSPYDTNCISNSAVII